MSYNFTQLDAFVALCKHLNFSRAAASIGLSQPSLSRQVASLERTLGVQLFLRDRQSVQLSNEGKRFQEDIQPVYLALRNELFALAEDSNSIRGELSLASYREVGQSLFFPIVLKFIKENPSVSYRVQYLGGDEIVSGVVSGSFQFGILSKPSSNLDLICRKIHEEELVLVSKKAAPKLLSHHSLKLVGYREYDPIAEIHLNTLKKQYEDLSWEFKGFVNSHASMIASLNEDKSLSAIVPKDAVARELGENRLIQSTPEKTAAGLYLVEAPTQYQTKVHKAFKLFLNEQLNLRKGGAER